MAAKKDNAKQHAQLIAQLAIVFGGKCAKCSCRNIALFEFHHKDGGGTKERKTHFGVKWLRNLLDECKELHGPKDGIEILCANCHAEENSKGVRAVCLTTKLTSTLIGISWDELYQLVESEKIRSEPPATGRSKRKRFDFTVQALLDYVFSSADQAATTRQRILSRQKDAAKVQSGKKNHSKRKPKVAPK